jgi:hypothetical protein
MENLSIKIKAIISSLAIEVNDLNKEYTTEKITSVDKKEQIECGVNIAQYRAVNAIKNTFNEILTVLKEERINQATCERVKDLFNGCM